MRRVRGIDTRWDQIIGRLVTSPRPLPRGCPVLLSIPPLRLTSRTVTAYVSLRESQRTVGVPDERPVSAEAWGDGGRGGTVADGNVGGPGWDCTGSALDELQRPVTILAGPSGSGKTEIAVNLAFGWRNRGAKVTLVDLDLGKPLFRCRLAKEELESRGIRLVAPAGDRFYADLPILLPEARAAGRSGAGSGGRLIFDLGGDGPGARALGSLAGLFDDSATELLFVVNTNRPFAEGFATSRRNLGELQAAARMAVTGFIANTHLLEETTPEMVRSGVRVARELEAATGIPVRFCAILGGMAAAFGGPHGVVDQARILAMERHIVPPFAKRPSGAARRSVVV